MLHEFSQFLSGYLGDGKSGVTVACSEGHPALRVSDEESGLMMEIRSFGDLKELPEIEVFGAAWNEFGEVSGSMSIHAE